MDPFQEVKLTVNKGNVYFCKCLLTMRVRMGKLDFVCDCDNCNLESIKLEILYLKIVTKSNDCDTFIEQIVSFLKKWLENHKYAKSYLLEYDKNRI